eukprot:m.86699 g.86699  ORF g.86699 m.86699 type:complete len:312 (+) comp13065_c1_seq5:377-1312(+)
MADILSATDSEACCAYIASYQGRSRDLESWLTDPLYLSGLYWGMNTTFLLNKPDTLSREFILQAVDHCFDENSGGYSGCAGHDAHITHTLSAIQILKLVNALDSVDVESVMKFLKTCYKGQGLCCGDEFGEDDTRFSYCFVSCAALLGQLDNIDTDAIADHVLRCLNVFGGFGLRPGTEAHAGQTFCCVATLAICGRLGSFKHDGLVSWLLERQLDTGAVNGRPDKKEDGCYGWWVVASLSLLDKMETLRKPALKQFLLGLQDKKIGGFRPRVGSSVDVFHTHFVVAALGLLDTEGVARVDSRFCLPIHCM